MPLHVWTTIAGDSLLQQLVLTGVAPHSFPCSCLLHQTEALGKNTRAGLFEHGSDVSGLSGCAGLWFSHSFSKVLDHVSHLSPFRSAQTLEALEPRI